MIEVEIKRVAGVPDETQIFVTLKHSVAVPADVAEANPHGVARVVSHTFHQQHHSQEEIQEAIFKELTS